jgi:hypothetical protein
MFDHIDQNHFLEEEKILFCFLNEEKLFKTLIGGDESFD